MTTECIRWCLLSWHDISKFPRIIHDSEMSFINWNNLQRSSSMQILTSISYTIHLLPTHFRRKPKIFRAIATDIRRLRILFRKTIGEHFRKLSRVRYLTRDLFNVLAQNSLIKFFSFNIEALKYQLSREFVLDQPTAQKKKKNRVVVSVK